MDIKLIQSTFADELAKILRAKSSRSRKYSNALKEAIIDLHAEGVSIEHIQKELGFTGGAFKTWIRHAAPKRQKSAFAPIAVAAGPVKAQPLSAADLIIIKLPSGIEIRCR